MRQSFDKGDLVMITRDALENYGPEYAGRVFVIEHVATKYMPASEFFNKGMPDGYHPGFDKAAGEALYDLIYAGTGGELGFSLYDWELESY